jgi:hypothetical protein
MRQYVFDSFAEPHNLYAALALVKHFDAAPIPLYIYSKSTFFKPTEVNTNVANIFWSLDYV